MNLRKLLSLICALTLMCSFQLPTTAYELNKQDSFSTITKVEELKHESVMYDKKATAGSCSIMTLDNSPSVTYTYRAANAPNCENDGNVEYWESPDGEFYTDENGKTEILSIIDPATGHKWGEPLWKWDGYDSATATFTCKNDDSHIQMVEANIKRQTTKPKCTTDGQVMYTATVELNGHQFSDKKIEKLPAIEHDWAEPEWKWELDTSSTWTIVDGKRIVTARFICKNDNSHTRTERATVTNKKVDATCNKNGSITRTAEVWFDGKKYTDVQIENIPSTGHKFGEPEWTWNGYDSATATFTCKNDDSHIETSDAAIKTQTTLPTCESNGQVVYTATVKFNGNTYNDSKTENLDALGHSYNISNWNWDGYEKAIATLICENDKSHTKLIKAEVKSEKIDDRQTIYTATVLVDGIAYTNEKIKTEDYLIGIIGDMDGDGKITSADSLLILRQSVSLENFTDEQLLLADVDGDNRITSADALEVLRFSVSLPTRGNIGKEMIK